MKKLLFALVVPLSMLVLLTAGSVYAQNRIQVDVPFVFSVMEKQFLPDTYTAELSHPLSPRLIQVRTLDRSHQVFLITNYLEGRLNQEVTPKYVFR